MYFKKNLVQNYIWVPIKRPLKICQVFRNLEEPGYREEASGLAPGFSDQIIDNQFELNCTGSHTYTLFCKRRTRMDFSENTLDFLFLIISFSPDTLWTINDVTLKDPLERRREVFTASEGTFQVKDA